MGRERIMYDSDTFNFVEVCFVTQDLVHLGDGSAGI